MGFEPTFSTTSYEYPPYQGGSVLPIIVVSMGIEPISLFPTHGISVVPKPTSPDTICYVS
jgi:hypothetical protein